jgi:hypothetical protein
MAIVISGAAVASHAQSTESANDVNVGRINFEVAGQPPATVEVDLSQEMFRDMFGLGEAAAAGVAETLFRSAEGDGGTQGVRLAAEQLEAARQILQLASEVVREVRIRVYEPWPKDAGEPGALVGAYEKQLSDGNWETLVRVRKDRENVRISVLRGKGALRGVFITAAQGDQLVFANAVCDVSPENVKKLSSAATKIGLENGLKQAIELKMQKLHPPVPPPPPPPRP